MVERTSGVVMVVDDDEDWRELVVQFLRDAGFEAVGASHGREALARIRGGLAPDLLVIDLEMPVMTGWELRRELLRDPALAGLPVLVASSADPGPLAADPCLAKPYGGADLLRAIGALRTTTALAA
jgi:CheY-like chemotaxis protein